MQIGNFEGSPSVKYMNALPWAVQKWLNRFRCRFGYLVMDSGWHKEPHIWCGSRSPQAKGKIFRERTSPGMPNDTLPPAAQK